MGGRKGKAAGCFQFPQRLQAAIALRLAARVVKLELFAPEIGQLRPADELAIASQQPGNIGNGRGLRERPLDLVLTKHADRVRQGDLFVQYYLRGMGRPGRGIA